MNLSSMIRIPETKALIRMLLIMRLADDLRLSGWREITQP